MIVGRKQARKERPTDIPDIWACRDLPAGGPELDGAATPCCRRHQQIAAFRGPMRHVRRQIMAGWRADLRFGRCRLSPFVSSFPGQENSGIPHLTDVWGEVSYCRNEAYSARCVGVLTLTALHGVHLGPRTTRTGVCLGQGFSQQHVMDDCVVCRGFRAAVPGGATMIPLRHWAAGRPFVRPCPVRRSLKLQQGDSRRRGKCAGSFRRALTEPTRPSGGINCWGAGMALQGLYNRDAQRYATAPAWSRKARRHYQ